MVLLLTALSGVSTKGWVGSLHVYDLMLYGHCMVLSQASCFPWTSFEFDFSGHHLAQLKVHEQEKSKVTLSI